MTRTFLKKYMLHFADTTTARLGYAVDDRFYGLDGEGHLARFRRMLDEITLDEVNAAMKRHWQYDNVKIAIVTGEAAAMRALLARGEPTPISYATPKPAPILEEDRIIEAWPLNLAEERMITVPVAEAFER
jgi:zinc protease